MRNNYPWIHSEYLDFSEWLTKVNDIANKIFLFVMLGGIITAGVILPLMIQ